MQHSSDEKAYFRLKAELRRRRLVYVREGLADHAVRKGAEYCFDASPSCTTWPQYTRMTFTDFTATGAAPQKSVSVSGSRTAIWGV